VLQDLGTLLTVKSVDGRTKSLYGAFEPAQRTRGGCQCSQLWSYTDAGGQTVTSRGQCVNPSGDALAWCQYEPGSCTGSELPFLHVFLQSQPVAAAALRTPQLS
jgi:hypothetical protein